MIRSQYSLCQINDSITGFVFVRRFENHFFRKVIFASFNEEILCLNIVTNEPYIKSTVFGCNIYLML